MGQYFSPLTEDKQGNKHAYSLQFKHNVKLKEYGLKDIVSYDEYTGLKLMEHSWMNNPFLKSFANLIYKNPLKISWVGDYYKGEANILAWGTLTQEEIEKKDFSFNHKFLVNHTQKRYIDFDLYIEDSTTKEGWCIHPLPLLTALGNGEGGGDFHKGTGKSYIGSWAGDIISIEDEAPKDYTQLTIEFIED